MTTITIYIEPDQLPLPQFICPSMMNITMMTIATTQLSSVANSIFETWFDNGLSQGRLLLTNTKRDEHNKPYVKDFIPMETSWTFSKNDNFIRYLKGIIKNHKIIVHYN